jgi:glycosyltransferase involved in cell wall biosynthesis
MRWISEKDEGLYDGMNKGIRMATGEVVGIINSDDFYHYNNIIAKIANTFEDKNIQSTFADIRFINPNNLNKTVRYYSSKNFSTKHFRFGWIPAHPTFFTYKKFFDEFGYYKTDYNYVADFELLIRFLYKHKLNYKYLPLDVMKMRTGGVSTASLKRNIMLNKERVRACRENGIYTNQFILFLRYFIKIFEFVFTKE